METLDQTVTQETQAEPQQPTNNYEDIIKNYDSMIKQQQEQIQQLIKQQELNNKVNKQLNDAIKQQAENTATQPKEHWVDEVIRNDFQFQAKYDYANETEPADQLTCWMVKYMKEREGLTNEQVSKNMLKLFEYMHSGKQDVQTPPKIKDFPNEVKYR